MGKAARKYITPQIEKRKHRRAWLVTEVRCEALGRETILVTRDVSQGGVFVSTGSPLPANSEVMLSFRLKPNESPISCCGRVAYALNGLGMGIAFLDLREEARQKLQKFVDEAD